MSSLAAYQPPPRGLTCGQARAAFLAVCVARAAVGMLAGRAGQPAVATNAVGLLGGIPVGIEHSPAGALAGADDYLSVEQQTVERDPPRFAKFVAVAYAPAIRAGSLADAASERRSTPAGSGLWAHGGQSFTVIGAHRLDYYRGDTARVTTWAGEIYWSWEQPPEQVWRLGLITVRWFGDRWLVTAMRTLPDVAPAPAATPQAGPGDDAAAVFNRLLAGFTRVGYGAADG